MWCLMLDGHQQPSQSLQLDEHLIRVVPHDIVINDRFQISLFALANITEH